MARVRCVLFAICLLSLPSAAQRMETGGHVVSGYVREESSSTAVESVALDIFSSGQRAAQTAYSNLDGQFAFAPVRDGDYYLVARKEGYTEATVRVSVTPSGAQPVFISLPRVHPEATPAPSDPVSLRRLSIPKKAQEAFDKGRKLLYEKASPEKAIAEFQRATEEFPTYYEAYTQIGVAQYRLKKPSEAEGALRRAIELSTNQYPEALYLLAGILNDDRRFTEAGPVAKRAAELNDKLWQAYFELARSLVGLKQARAAEVSALKVQELKPDNPDTNLVLANAHMLEQNYAAAVQDFDAYLKLVPSGPNHDAIAERRQRLQRALRNAQAGNTGPPDATR